jgi:hypothetical protein
VMKQWKSGVFGGGKKEKFIVVSSKEKNGSVSEKVDVKESVQVSRKLKCALS